MNNYKIKTLMIQNKWPGQQNINECIFSSSNLLKTNYIEFIENSEQIINISIQAQPGLEFYINNNNYPIIIGANGFFSWEIKIPNTYIYSLKIKKINNEWPIINPYSTIIVTYEYINNEEE